MESMEFLSIVFAIVLGNGLTILLGAIVALTALLFRGYLWTILWAAVIGQALQSAKERTMECLATLSRDRDHPERSMLAVLWDDVRRGLRRRHRRQPIFTILLEFILENGITGFALVGFVSLMSHLVPLWLIALCAAIVIAPMVGLLYLVDRAIFCYRAVVRDETVASIFVIGVFFSSVSFIIIFLGTESLLEGATAWNAASAWVQGMLDDEGNKAEWAKQISRANAFARESFAGLEENFGETVWFPVVNITVQHYLAHGTLAVDPKGFVGELFPPGALHSGVSAADYGSNSFLATLSGGSGGTSNSLEGFVAGLRGHLNGLNVSLDKAYEYATYAGVGGKVVAGLSLEGVQLLSTLASFLLGLGFKVVFFFTTLFYFTSCGDLLERAVADLLPVPPSQKAGVVRRLRRGIEGVFFLPCKIACFHGIVTLCWFTLLDVEFPFFATFLTVLLSVTPLVPAYYAALPWLAVRLFTSDWITGVLLFSVHYLSLYWIDNFLCGRATPTANPYLTFISIFLGFAVFGTQGVVLGPLIISLGMLIYSSLGYLESSSLAAVPPTPGLAAASAPTTPTGGKSAAGRKASWLASPSGLHLAEQRGVRIRRGASLSLQASPVRAQRTLTPNHWRGGTRARVRTRGLVLPQEQQQQQPLQPSQPSQPLQPLQPSPVELAATTSEPDLRHLPNGCAASGVLLPLPAAPDTGAGPAAVTRASTSDVETAAAAGSAVEHNGVAAAAAAEQYRTAGAIAAGTMPSRANGVAATRRAKSPSAFDAAALRATGAPAAAVRRPRSIGPEQQQLLQQQGRPRTHVHASSSPPSLTEALLQRVGNALLKSGRPGSAPLEGSSGGGGGGSSGGENGDLRRGSVSRGESDNESIVRIKVYLKPAVPPRGRGAPPAVPPAAKPGWRMDIRRDSTWNSFLREVAALLDLPGGIKGVCDANGLVVRSVAYFDAGESLFVEPADSELPSPEG